MVSFLALVMFVVIVVIISGPVRIMVQTVLLPFTDGQEEGAQILVDQWAVYCQTRPKLGDHVFVG